MKKQRQDRIIELISDAHYRTQEELTEALNKEGFRVTQATVSRDIREMKLAKRAIDALPELRYSEVHSTVILSQVDTDTFRKLGVNLTVEPKYQTKKLFHH